MTSGGARPGSGRKKKSIDGPELPPRKRGRPSNAEKAARAAAEAEWLANAAKNPPPPQLETARAAAPPPAAPPVVVKAPAYTPEMPPDVEPLDYFLRVMRDPNVAAERRDRAAQVAIGFTTAKPGEGKKGKKEQRLETAQGHTESGGAFTSGRPPLSVVGGA